MADDLDDAWWQQNSDNEDEEGHSEQDRDSHSDDSKHQTNIKRKRENSGESEEDTADNDKVSKSSKKKKKKRKKITEELKEKVPEVTKSEHLLQSIDKHFKDKLSSVEQDELELNPVKDFHVCSSLEDTPTSYLRTILPKWKKLMKKSELPPGSPLLLLITSSAIRAVQLNREIQDFKGEDAKCAKLFAKHFKLEEQKKYLSKNICHIGIGSPNRLHALLKNDALHLDHVKTIVIDWNWRDVKSKRLVDIPEIRKDFMTLLQTFLIQHVHNTKCKIGLL